MIRGLYKALVDSRVRRDWRWLIARRFTKWLQPEYRTLDWAGDAWFVNFLERFGLSGNPHAGNRWNLYQFARSAAAIPGDTAECGVFQGAGSYLICSATSAPTRTHYAFDSFAGLSTPSKADGTYWRRGDLMSTIEVAQKHLQGFNVSWHPGWIPDRFKDVKDVRFAFVHIDVDLEEPTRASLEFFYPRLNPGGILLCDDYGFEACAGVTRAMNEFFANTPERLVGLASGAGFIIKR